MKLSHVFGVAALVLPLMAFAADAIPASPSIEISPVSQHWRFTRYKVVQQEGKSVVAAWLLQRTNIYMDGHIQAQAFDPTGRLIATSECRSTTRALSSRQRHSSSGDYVQMAFNSLLPADAAIKVGVFHNRDCAQPTP